MLSVKIAVSVTLGLLCWNIFGEVIAQRDVDERKGHMRQASQEFSTDKGKGQLNMNDRSLIQVPAPKFEQYESVILHWNSQEYRTKIVRRWFDVDDGDGCWWYETTVEQLRLYPEKVLEHRE